MEKTIHLLIMYTMLVLMLLLFHKGRKHPRSLILALYALIEVITNGIISLNMAAGWGFFDRFPFTHFVYKPLYCLWVPFFYFYFRACLSSGFRIGKSLWPHILPFFISLVFFLSVLIAKGNHYIWENLYKENSFVNNTAFAVDITVKVQYLVYNFLMIKSLLKFETRLKTNDTISVQPAADLHWLRVIVYGYAVGCLIAIISFVFNLYKSPVAPIVNMVSVSYFFLFFFVIFYNTITHSLFEDETKSRVPVSPNNEMRKLMDRIEEQVVGKQMYLGPELSLQQIASVLNEKERNISQAINTTQKRNVTDYINSLRIEYACHLLLENKEKPVFEVMYESGFNTKGAFNLTFKRFTGKTPTQFREG
jgi:AraC-like DNA-binding protein